MKLKSVWLTLLVGVMSYLTQDSYAQSKLHQQIPQNPIEQIETTLSAHRDIEELDANGDTAVLIAARNGRIDVLRLLVKLGADINVLDRKKRDILNIAITTRNPELARVALELGADPTLVTSIYEGGAIIYGSAKGAVDIVEMLIGAGAPMNRINNIGLTALLEVAILGDGSNNYVKIAQMLVDAGADKTIQDRNGRSAFDHAISRGHKRLGHSVTDSFTTFIHRHRLNKRSQQILKIFQSIIFKELLCKCSRYSQLLITPLHL